MKTAIITGGAKGIGRAIALKFAKEGVNIVVNYFSTEPAALISEIEALGVEAIGVKADVSKFDEAKALVDACMERFGRVDYLVNNAGITKDGLIMMMKEADFDAVIDTNLKGTFNTMRHASPIMLKQKSGAIVNIASIAAFLCNAGQANYTASKAGVIGMTKSVARELGSRGITVNAVAPGFIETDMTDDLSDKIKEYVLQNVALKRFGKAHEVAELVYFVANCGYMTGETVTLDGGWT
ncbi:MAG: 3-oxoacyl-[acyl-carrier-protein] reductase [Defluviitaleaceae bacterium]|nr:3-oxoacyl-[acyl-carrier-protein] reductase [Defluviitaleaceae bacterium]